MKYVRGYEGLYTISQDGEIQNAKRGTAVRSFMAERYKRVELSLKAREKK